MNANVTFLDDIQDSIAEFNPTVSDGTPRDEESAKSSPPDTHAPGNMRLVINVTLVDGSAKLLARIGSGIIRWELKGYGPAIAATVIRN